MEVSTAAELVYNHLRKHGCPEGIAKRAFTMARTDPASIMENAMLVTGEANSRNSAPAPAVIPKPVPQTNAAFFANAKRRAAEIGAEILRSAPAYLVDSKTMTVKPDFRDIDERNRARAEAIEREILDDVLRDAIN